MLFLESNLDAPDESLALDEALLEQAERNDSNQEWLRIWIPRTLAIVVGRSSRVADEVNVELAESLHIPIVRRSSGGAAVVIGPGCVAYSLILDCVRRPNLTLIDAAHQFVMQRMIVALKELDARIETNGISDLVVGDRKISGNSLRYRRKFLLYHGTLLADMDLDLVDQLLKHPPREPAYRHRRRHSDFMANIQLPSQVIIEQLRSAWICDEICRSVPIQLVEQFLRERFQNSIWNLQR